ncbi:CRE-LIN-49 protein [Caenorhabditis remanei]|uniref:CRE-LIN-49 protein n=1 Tax=Caenorhabditis remanei TaxID=31234 RepID=E3N2K6_CAERE|nr:CRE-LIN-49 protein [Caenorhabditis remanei]
MALSVCIMSERRERQKRKSQCFFFFGDGCLFSSFSCDFRTFLKDEILIFAEFFSFFFSNFSYFQPISFNIITSQKVKTPRREKSTINSSTSRPAHLDLSGMKGGRSGGGGVSFDPTEIDVDDDESVSDRTQHVMGEFEGKVVSMVEMCSTSQEPLEQRQKRWRSTSQEAKIAKFKKYYQPQISKKLLAFMKEPFGIGNNYFKFPAGSRFGFPLGEFPELKYDFYKIIRMNDEKGVDYIADEYDLKWMELMNKDQHYNGNEMYSVAIFEHWMDRLEKMSIWKPKEHLKLKDENGRELDDVCNICLDGDTSNCNQIVYCDRCNLTVHQDCYGIPFIPDGCLECRRCLISPARRVHCVLCPSRKGAFKQVDHNRWVHVLCVIWVDETHFGNTIFMENVQNVEKAIHDRKALSCMLCKDRKHARMGACIQCSEAKCTASFHVTCARNSGLVMRITESDDGTVSRFVWCPKHTPELTEADKVQHQLMLRNARRENEKNLPGMSMPTLTTSIITRIRLEQPFSDFREIIYFWYQKRQSRLGAPLLKAWKQEDPLDSPLKSTPDETRRRRSSVQMRALEDVKTPVTTPSNSKNPEKEQAEKQLNSTKKSMELAIELSKMMTKREEQKRELILTSIRMITLGFKTNDIIISDAIEDLKLIDKENVFAEPVDVFGYEKVIENPICLRDITEKATAKRYDSVTQLTADITLMLQNCATFNKKTPWFIAYGKKYKKESTPILEAAQKEESERAALKNDEKFMTELLNGVMADYNGSQNLNLNPPTSSKKSEDVAESRSASSQNRRRRRQHQSPMTVEDVTNTVQEDVKSEEVMTTTKKSSRKRGIQETLLSDSDDVDPSKPSTSGIIPVEFAVRESRLKARNIEEIVPTRTIFGTLRKRVSLFENSQKNLKKPLESPLTQKQTKLTNFFVTTPKVTFFDRIQRKNIDDSKRSLFPLDASKKSTLFTFTSLPPSTSPAFSTSIGRPNTRSSSLFPSSLTSSGGSRRSAFRMSSSMIQSPLPDPKKVGIRAMNSDDDDEEIVIQPPPQQLSPKELEAERLRSAENEAKSKFAHNQLVIVDGKAAKVIESQLAHLTDIHQEQRQSMLKKRREVLSEIPTTPLIYVEFFQKSSTYENFQWVHPDKVELLDLNNINQRSPKITGLKAARDWHQKVLNGEDV